MQALRWHGRNDIRLDDISPPGPPADGEVTIRVAWCGICGTDVEEWLHGPLFIAADAPNPLTGQQAPIVLGHEIGGEIVQVGAGVDAFEAGDRVGVDGIMSCGRCYWCLRHRITLCPQLAAVGIMSDGGLAEFVNVPASTCVRLPDELPTEAGALAEPLSVGVHGLRQGRLVPGERVAVIGAGTVGLLAAQAARAMGASQVCVVERLPARRAVAEKLGLPTCSVDGGLDADVVLECSGSAAAVGPAIAGARRGGRIVLVGITESAPPLDLLELVRTEKEVIGSLSHVCDEDFAAAVSLLAGGGVQMLPLISDRITLDRVIPDGLQALVDHPADHLKILVSPT